MSLTPDKDNLENGISSAKPEEMPASEQTPDTSETEQSTIFAKHVYDTKKPAENGSKKRIAICAVAAVLCAATVGGIFLVDRFIPDGSSSSNVSIVEETSVSVLKYADIVKASAVTVDGESALVDTNIEKVRFVNGNGEFTAIPYFEKIEESDSDTSSASSTSSETTAYTHTTKWYIEGIDPSMTDSSSIASTVKECLGINAFREMENTFASVEEYHQYYGMTDKLTAGCVIDFNDGTEQLLITVGNLLATGDAYYFKTSLSDTVYVVKSDYAERYFCSSKEMADATVIEKIVKTDDNASYFNSDGELARFDSIKLSGAAFDGKTYEFKMATGASADYMPYLMTVPYNRPADDEFISKILDFAGSGLDASTLYSYSISDKDIKEAGFEDPKGIIEVRIGDYYFKLTIGGYLGDGTESVTAMVDGKKQVFGISTDDFAFIINASNDITEMFNSNFIMEDIYTVKSVDIADSTGSYSFDLKHVPRESDSSVYDTTVTKNGTVMNTQSFKLIYQRILMLSMTEFVTEAEHTEPVLKVTFHFIEGGSKTVELTPVADDMYHYIAWVDGTPLGEVIKSGVDDIVSCLETYLNGGEVPDTW